MQTDTDEDTTGLTEFTDLAIHRVDAVKGPANGSPFIVAKGVAPMLGITAPPTPEVPAMDAAVAPADAPVAKDMPGDAMWEAADAARGRQVAMLLAQARSGLCDAKDSELMEMNMGAEDGSSDYWDLDCALDCLDSALAIVARFAVTEAQEATDAAGETMGDEAMMAGVAKAGKRLSAASMAHAKAAHEHLSALIGDEGGKVGAEEADQEAEVSKELEERMTGMESTLGTIAEQLEGVAKAIDAAKIDPVVAPEGAPDNSEAAAKAAAEGGTGEAAPDAAGTGGAASADGLTVDVFKSTMEEVVKAQLAPFAERLANVENQPAGGGPILGAGGRHADGVLGGATDMAGVRKALEGTIKDPQVLDQTLMSLGASTLSAMYRGDAPAPA